MNKAKILKDIYCTSKKCGEILCRSDGENLYVENLEISPKIEDGERNKVYIICHKCGRRKKYFWKVSEKRKPYTSLKDRKSSIFRSRF